MTSYKPHFSRFLSAMPNRLHLAAHSHHYWPDVTFEAQQRYWLDSALHADDKWGLLFGRTVPEAQAHVARLIGLREGGSVAFAPNTHDFVRRLISCLPLGRPPRLLTTDGEFHSFARQVRRLEEERLVAVTRIPAEPFATLQARLAAAAARGGWDLVFFSHVLFNSGYVLPDIGAVVSAVPDRDTLVAVDGYHAFMALPVDISALQDRIFYMAGGYKYAMSGEGACFLHAPAGYAARPRDTGWFAAFGALAGGGGDAVPYGADGGRFLGATFDPSALYRFNAAMGWLRSQGLDPAAIHAHVLAIQEDFLAGLARAPIPGLELAALVVPAAQDRGHFLTFRTPRAAEIRQQLAVADIVADSRDDRLRLGFGLYHDRADVPEMLERIGRALAAA